MSASKSFTSMATEKTPLIKSSLIPSSDVDESTSPFAASLDQNASHSSKSLFSKLRCCRHSPQMRRRFLYGNICVFVFLNGVEYSVILPTLWLYIEESFGGSSSFLGLCIAAFAISSLLACPLVGYINDWTRDTKTMLIVCNSFEIVGNIIYLFRIQWLVFVARLTAGVGSAAAPILFADVNRATPPEKRTVVLSFIALFRQVGLFIGPAFNIFLSQMDFYIGSVHVDAFTSPGFVMSILWILHQTQVLFTFYNIEEYAELLQTPDSSSTQDDSQSRFRWDACKSPNAFQVSQTLSPCFSPTFVDPVTAASSEKPEGKSELHQKMSDCPEKEAKNKLVKKAVPWRVYWDEYTEENIIVLLGVTFIIFFAQNSLETLWTPLTEKLFHWGELENSALFAVAGITVLCVCLTVGWASKRVNDRNITFVGLSLMTISLIWSVSTLPSGYYGQPGLLFHFIASTALSVSGLSISSVTAFSLFSKALGEKTQGFGSGLRRSLMNLAFVLAPIWSGALFDRLYIMFGVNLSLVSLFFGLYLLSWKKMLPKTVPKTAMAEEV